MDLLVCFFLYAITFKIPDVKAMIGIQKSQ